MLVGVRMGGLSSCDPFGEAFKEGVIIGVLKGWTGGEEPALKPFEDHGRAHAHHAKICT